VKESGVAKNEMAGRPRFHGFLSLTTRLEPIPYEEARLCFSRSLIPFNDFEEIGRPLFALQEPAVSGLI
jgi:hypothetical protein